MKKILALALALCFAVALVGCSAPAVDDPADTTVPADTSAPVDTAEPSDTAEPAVPEEDVKGEGVMTYAEYAAAELDAQVVVEAYVQAKQAYDAEKSAATVYAQDQDGAYLLYNLSCSAEDYENLVPGAKIKVTGYKAEWAGEVEIIDATFELLEGSYIAEPIDATELLASEDLVNYQNQKASFSGMTVAASTDADGNEVAYLYSWDGSGQDGDDLYFNASVNDAVYTFVVESSLCDSSSEVYAAVKNLQIGDVINLEGFLYWYEGVQTHVTSVTPAA